MEVTIKGTAKEIAALVVEVQKQLTNTIKVNMTTEKPRLGDHYDLLGKMIREE